MPVLLNTQDARISISFSCPGKIPDSLPAFVERKPPKPGVAKSGNIKPFYKQERPVLASGLPFVITANNQTGLAHVSTREKYWPDQSTTSVLTFLFSTHEESWTTELSLRGMDLLQLMAARTWRKVLMFKQSDVQGRPNTNIILSRDLTIPEGAQYENADEWGLQKLIRPN